MRKQVTKKMISAMRNAAFESLKSNFTREEWDSFFAGGLVEIYLIKAYDNKNTVYKFLSYGSQINSANLENYGLSKNGTYEILGMVNKQTKTFTPTMEKITATDRKNYKDPFSLDEFKKFLDEISETNN